MYWLGENNGGGKKCPLLKYNMGHLNFSVRISIFHLLFMFGFGGIFSLPVLGKETNIY